MQPQTRGDLAGLTLWSLPLRGGAEGNSLNLKEPNQTWTQGRGAAVEIPPWSTSWEERGSVGASPTPFPGNSRAARGCGLGLLRPPQPELGLGRLQGETLGCPGKGGPGRPAGPVLGRSCPFLGRILMQSPTPCLPSPAPCTPASGSPGLILWKALGEEILASDSGRRLASLVPEPVCSARTPSQRPQQPLQEAPGLSVSISALPRRAVLGPAPPAKRSSA